MGSIDILIPFFAEDFRSFLQRHRTNKYFSDMPRTVKWLKNRQVKKPMKWPNCDLKSEFEYEPKGDINILNAFEAKMFIEVGQEENPL